MAQSAAPDQQSDDSSGGDPTEIVLLGVSHFAGSVMDERTSEVEDILSDTRQQELESVAERIAGWEPDQFFTECRPPEQSTVDSLYWAYRAGDYRPTEAGDRNEIRQLGFRAAGKANLERLGCVDASGIWLGPQAQKVAKEHNPDVFEAYQQHADNRFDDAAYLASHTIGEYLLELNTEQRLYGNHKSYSYYYARVGTFDSTGMKTRREGDLGGQTFAFAGALKDFPLERARKILNPLNGRVVETVGPDVDYVVVEDRSVAEAEQSPEVGPDTLSAREFSDLIQLSSTTWIGFPDHHIGADLVGEWYKRNLRIYANIWRAVEPGSGRVIVMLGQGHIWTLRQFFRENLDFEVVPVSEVL